MRLEANAPNTVSLEEIIKAFQLHFESGYAKVGALRAMDQKIKNGKISPQLRLGFGYGAKNLSSESVNPLVVEPETTFEINRNVPGPSTGGTQTVNPTAATATSSISNRLEQIAEGRSPENNSDYDLEEKLNRILGDSYFR